MQIMIFHWRCDAVRKRLVEESVSWRDHRGLLITVSTFQNAQGIVLSVTPCHLCKILIFIRRSLCEQTVERALKLYFRSPSHCVRNGWEVSFKPLCSMWQHEETYSAVSLLRSRSLPGEQDEFGAVLLQTLYVGLERFCGSVATARVDRDANGAGCLLVDASCLQGGAQNVKRQQKNFWFGRNVHPIDSQVFNLVLHLEKAVIRKRVQSIHQENTEIPEMCHHLTAATQNMTVLSFPSTSVSYWQPLCIQMGSN